MGKRTLTPEFAERVLNHDNECNYRPYSEALATRYAKDMANGNWRYVAGQTIKFTKGGKLIDGQHRLGAVAISGQSQPFFVEDHYEEEDKYYVDLGKVRTLGNMLNDMGFKDPNNVSATVKLGLDVIAWRAGSGSGPNSGMKATNHTVVDLAKADPKIQSAVNAVATVPHKLLTRSVAAYCYRTFMELDEYHAAEFFYKLVNIEQLGDNDDAIAALHKRLAYGQWTAVGRALRLQKVATIIYAWNAWRNGEGRETLRLSSTRSGSRLIVPEAV